MVLSRTASQPNETTCFRCTSQHRELSTGSRCNYWRKWANHREGKLSPLSSDKHSATRQAGGDACTDTTPQSVGRHSHAKTQADAGNGSCIDFLHNLVQPTKFGLRQTSPGYGPDAAISSAVTSCGHGQADLHVEQAGWRSDELPNR